MVFSIIVPIYNVEKYLDKCITSIISQSYKHIEIILVNDGSTDGSLEICKNYKTKDNRISLLNKKNGGLSSARNYGLKFANGDYITFLDSDDFIDSGYFEDAYQCLNETNIDLLVYGYYRDLEENDKIISSIENRVAKNELITNIEKIASAMMNLKENNIADTSCTKFYRRELISKYDVTFPEGEIFEDTEFNFNLLNHTKTVLLRNKSFLHYIKRKNIKTITNTFNEYKLKYLLSRCMTMNKYILNIDFNDSNLKEKLLDLVGYWCFRYKISYFIDIAATKDIEKLKNEFLNLQNDKTYLLFAERKYRYLNLNKKIIISLLKINSYKLNYIIARFLLYIKNR